MINTDKAWSKWGQVDPYYGVLSDNKYRKENFDESAKSEFFESGREHVAKLLKVIQQHFGERQKFDACLDFGCGVGRLVIPLSMSFDKVVGMDISEAMLREAEINCRKKNVSNMILTKSDDDLSGLDGRFDLIHSYIVFQHIPVKRGMPILGKMLDYLNEDGIVAIHVPYYREASCARKLVCWLQKKIPGLSNVINPLRGRKINDPPVQMNYYNLNDILRQLNDKGIEKVLMVQSNDYDSKFVFIIGQKNV